MVIWHSCDTAMWEWSPPEGLKMKPRKTALFFFCMKVKREKMHPSLHDQTGSGLTLKVLWESSLIMLFFQGGGWDVWPQLRGTGLDSQLMLHFLLWAKYSIFLRFSVISHDHTVNGSALRKKSPLLSQSRLLIIMINPAICILSGVSHLVRGASLFCT